MNYYERHIGDYLKDTSHLSLLEHGIYTRLLDVYYTREGALPSDQVARLIGARSKDEREAMQSVLSEFFKLVDGAWSQDRCEREISRFKDKQRKAKASAEVRWAHTERNANAMRTYSGGNADGMLPVTSNQTPVSNTPKPPSAQPDGFASFWSAYPKKVNKAQAMKAFKAQRINGELPEILTDLEHRRVSPDWVKDNGQFIPNPGTYLTNRKWEETTVDADPYGLRTAL